MVPFNGLIYDLRDTWYILDFMVLPQGFQNARNYNIISKRLFFEGAIMLTGIGQ